MLNLNQADQRGIKYIMFLIVMIFVSATLTRSNTSGYTPRPITITTTSENSLFDLEHRLECAPGYTKEGSVYTMSLTPGGLCGSEKLVAQQAGYTIDEGGIGGSLI